MRDERLMRHREVAKPRWPLVCTRALAVCFLVSSCTTMEPQSGTSGAAQAQPQSGDATKVLQAGEGATEPREAESQATPGEVDPLEPGASQPSIYRGTGAMIRMPSAAKPVRFVGEAVSLNFEQAPLTDVVHAIMGDILEVDYFVEHPISGQVTLRTRNPVPREQLLDILESLLKANNALMIRDDEGRYYVSGSGQMSRLKPSVAASTAGVAGYSTLIVPLQHISASNMAEILRPVAEEEAFVRVDNLRNILMLAGTRAQLEGWQDIISTFDVDLLKGMSVGIFPIENASLEDIESALDSLMGNDPGPSEEMTQGLVGIGSLVKVIPVERLSSIMVVTPRPAYLERIELWIERLDREPDANFERRLYVYPVQNSNAAHLADLLSAIFGGDLGSSSRSRSGVAPGLTPERVTGGESRRNQNQNQAQASNRRTTPATSDVSIGSVKVVADEEKNALLIYATGKEYRKIKPALERLDIEATQVIIEASIIEVTLNDDLEYGLEWSFNGDLGGGYEGIGTLLNEGLGAAPGAGFTYQVLNASGQIKAVLSALATKDLLNVISSPSVMVLDNQTASIQVGDQVPVQSSETVTDGGNIRTSVTYRDTGVSLSVTPSVNAGGMVTMDIDQSVTDVGPIDPATGQRSFLERQITSRVAMRTAESVVLGGLIRENKSKGSSGIPLLHDLPLIGPLFGTRTQDDSRTELLVVITPRVIYGETELREVGREMKSQMRGLELLDVSRSSSFLSNDLPGRDSESWVESNE